jgi:hypothetical protein
MINSNAMYGRLTSAIDVENLEAVQIQDSNAG